MFVTQAKFPSLIVGAHHTFMFVRWSQRSEVIDSSLDLCFSYLDKLHELTVCGAMYSNYSKTL